MNSASLFFTGTEKYGTKFHPLSSVSIQVPQVSVPTGLSQPNGSLKSLQETNVDVQTRVSSPGSLRSRTEFSREKTETSLNKASFGLESVVRERVAWTHSAPWSSEQGYCTAHSSEQGTAHHGSAALASGRHSTRQGAEVRGTLNFGPLHCCPLGAIGLDLVKKTSVTA